jgi:hypothetical protein
MWIGIGTWTVSNLLTFTPLKDLKWTYLELKREVEKAISKIQHINYKNYFKLNLNI